MFCNKLAAVNASPPPIHPIDLYGARNDVALQKKFQSLSMSSVSADLLRSVNFLFADKNTYFL